MHVIVQLIEIERVPLSVYINAKIIIFITIKEIS